MSPIGRSNCSRSPAYDLASSSAACATPTACAAMPIRPSVSVRNAAESPFPGSVRRFSAGTRQSSKLIPVVSDARSPSFSSF